MVWGEWGVGIGWSSVGEGGVRWGGVNVWAKVKLHNGEWRGLGGFVWGGKNARF